MRPEGWENPHKVALKKGLGGKPENSVRCCDYEAGADAMLEGLLSGVTCTGLVLKGVWVFIPEEKDV